MLELVSMSVPAYDSATVVWSADQSADQSAAAKLEGQSCSTVCSAASYAGATLG
jgi:hypothetical protein